MATGGDEVVRLGYSWLARNFERVGLPTAGLIVLVALLCYAARWGAIKVVEPLVANHVAFLQASVKTMEANAEANRTNAQANTTNAETNQRIAETFEAFTEQIQQQSEILEELSRREGG